MLRLVYSPSPTTQSRSPSLGAATARREDLTRNSRSVSIGRIELDCDALLVDSTDLVLVVYSAPPGSRDAQAPELSASSACKNSLRLVDHGGGRRVEVNSPDAGPYVGVTKGIADRDIAIDVEGERIAVREQAPE